MAWGESTRWTAVPSSPGGRPAGVGATATREVVVLLSDASRRVRTVRALERAGYRVVIPRRPLPWLVARQSPVLVTDDTDAGLRIRTEVVAAAPTAACVVLVLNPTPERYRQLLAAGSTALPSSCADEDLVLAVGAASRALACLPATAARVLAGGEGERPVLTRQEVSWLQALVDGATVASLARAVGYSQRAMYRVLGGLYARLGAENRTEALLRADRWGLLTPAAVATPRISGVPGQRRPAAS